jgi:dGTPase
VSGSNEGRAIYAADPWASRGRLVPEEASPTRSPFQRDRDRIIHSTAFRRLKHKTQVFVFHEGDHYRTRLTHTIEVAQIARALARALRLDDDLAEALALSHDLGHTPFGHTGEDTLDELMRPWGGFDHNAQALRIVTALERRYAAFDGLNLTWETLEGLVKHNGPMTDRQGQGVGKYAGKPVPRAILDFNAGYDLWLWSHASLEAQAAALADDIAYDAHDLDDGLRAGLFTLEDLRAVPFLAGLLDEIFALWPGLETSRAIHELGRRVITRFVEDAISDSARRIAEVRPQTADDVRLCGHTLVAFSPAMVEADRAIKAFLFPNMYRAPSVVRIRQQADAIMRGLFGRFFEQPDLMPDEWHEGLTGAGEDKRARRVADYMAGMTDRFALDEHRRLFDVTPELR